MSLLKKIDETQSLPFYLIYFFTLCDSYLFSCNSLSNISLSPSTSVQFPLLLSFFGSFSLASSAMVLLALNLVIPLFCLIFINSQTLRILNFVLFFLTKGFIFSVWRVEHMYWPLLWTLLFFALAPNIELKGSNNRLTLYCYRGAVLSVLLFYFYPGLWKVFSGISSGEMLNVNYGSNMVAHYLISHGKKSLLGDFLVQTPAVTFLGLALTVIFQLSSILCLFSQKYLRLWPFGILIFHAVNIFAMNINFLSSGIVACIILWLAPPEVLLKVRK